MVGEQLNFKASSRRIVLRKRAETESNSDDEEGDIRTMDLNCDDEYGLFEKETDDNGRPNDEDDVYDNIFPKFVVETNIRDKDKEMKDKYIKKAITTKNINYLETTYLILHNRLPDRVCYENMTIRLAERYGIGAIAF